MSETVSRRELLKHAGAAVIAGRLRLDQSPTTGISTPLDIVVSTVGERTVRIAIARSGASPDLIERAVDLETIPLHVRAGTVLPMAPVRQYVQEPVNGPLALTVYPGADATSAMYEDNGMSFEYRRDAWMRMDMAWRDAARTLTLRLAPGSRMLSPARRTVDVRVAGETRVRSLEFSGEPVTVKL